MATVKREGPGQARRERARATRRRMLEAAYRLFCEQGYVATTMDAVAREADVAVQTIYFTFHTKADLLKEVVGVTATGDDPAPFFERPWVKEAGAADEGHRLLDLVVDHGSDIYRRLAPLTPALETAASVDPDIAAYRRLIRDQRKGGMGYWVDRLTALGQLRPELSRERAADILFVLQSPETYLAFTAGCGWSVEEWKAWQYRMLCQQLLAEP